MKYIKIITLVLFFLVLTINVKGQISDISNCYDFENDLTDSTGSGNDGSMINNGGFDTGIVGTALSLSQSNNSYTSYPSQFIDFDKDFTLIYWQKTSSYGGVNQWVVTDSNGVAGSVGYTLGYLTSSTDYTTTQRGTANHVWSVPSINSFANSWVMVAFIHNSSTNKNIGFWNLTEYTPGTGTFDFNSGVTSSHYIGQHPNPATAIGWNGQLDTFIFINRSVDYSEIEQIYNSGLGLSCADVINGTSPSTPNGSITITTSLQDGTQNFNQNPLTIYYNLTPSDTDIELYDCELHVNDIGNISTKNVNSSVPNNVFNFDTTNLENNYTFRVDCFAPIESQLTNSFIQKGTYLNGTNSSILTFNDNSSLNIREVTGTNAITFIANYTNITSLQGVQINWLYKAIVPHDIHFEAWNYTNSQWYLIDELVSPTQIYTFSNYDFNTSLWNQSDFVNNTDMRLRINHPQAGNINHIFSIDYMEPINFDFYSSSDSATYNIDTVKPSFTTTIINNTQYSQNSNLDLYINFTDKNLFAYNVTIKDAVFDVWNSENYFLENISSTSQLLDETVILTQQGVFYIDIFVWDSHTAQNNIKPLDWYFIDNDKLYADGIIFEGDFKTYNPKQDLITYFILDKDRYKFQATFEEQALQHSIIIEAKDFIYVGDRYGYKGHFVSLSKNRWLDFEGKNIKSINVRDLGNSRYNISTTHYYETDEILFESIGDLNVYNATYTYEVISASTVNTTKIEELLYNLTQLQTQNNNSVFNIDGGITMLWAIILGMVFLIIGIITKISYWGVGTGFSFIIVSVFNIQQLAGTNPTLFNYAISIGFGVLGLITILVSVLIAWMPQKDNSDTFYY